MRVVESTGKASLVAEAVQMGLDAVRETFGWAYGSWWRLDEAAQVLRFAIESGSLDEEFQKLSRETPALEGIGMHGRVWKEGDLVYIRDIGDLEGARAAAGRRAGIRSCIAFPIMVNGKYAGNMDFISRETLDLSEERLAALRNVGRLVSAAIERAVAAEGPSRKSRQRAGCQPGSGSCRQCNHYRRRGSNGVKSRSGGFWLGAGLLLEIRSRDERRSFQHRVGRNQ